MKYQRAKAIFNSTLPLIGFDLETSGKYPLSSEICEIAAVKWVSGEIVDTFQTLVAINAPMSQEVIDIHHITDEMLIGAPSVAKASRDFHSFIGGGVLVAHHAPFDMGFLAHEFEKLSLPLPRNAVLCSSLLSRLAFPNLINHKLQTLVKELKIDGGTAHRALDDARACLYVALDCIDSVPYLLNIDDVFQYQQTRLDWSKFSLHGLRTRKEIHEIINAIEQKSPVQIVYGSGSRPGQPRTVFPIGLVRNPNGDFLVAHDNMSEPSKRYYLDKIVGVSL
jgi:DNA polymerase-3 subunit epsilon